MGNWRANQDKRVKKNGRALQLLWWGRDYLEVGMSGERVGMEQGDEWSD